MNENEDKSYNTVEEMFDDLEKDVSDIYRLSNKIFPNGLFGYNAFYIITHPWKIMEKGIDEIKWTWQRVFRGWDDRVIWSVDWYLAEKIPFWVRRLKKTAGIPCEMFDELPYENENLFTYSKESEIIAKNKWEQILENIAIGFESYIALCDRIERDDCYQELTEKYERGFDLFREYFGNLWN